MNWFKFPKKKKDNGYRKLLHKLDVLFSKYIRLRDADYRGMCRCITCGKIFHWKEGDAGHFIQRDRLATRWDPRNVHAQCSYCNRFRSGEQWQHGVAIDKKHGKGTAEYLKNISLARGSKISTAWLEYQIMLYKSNLKGMKDKENACGGTI